MNERLKITKMGVKNDRVFFPGVSLLRIQEYFKQTLSEAQKLFRHYNVLFRKNRPRSLAYKQCYVSSILPKLKVVSNESNISQFFVFSFHHIKSWNPKVMV